MGQKSEKAKKAEPWRCIRIAGQALYMDKTNDDHTIGRFSGIPAEKKLRRMVVRTAPACALDGRLIKLAAKMLRCPLETLQFIPLKPRDDLKRKRGRIGGTIYLVIRKDWRSTDDGVLIAPMMPDLGE